MNEATQPHDKLLAVNEALTLGAVHQHELTEAAEALNELLQAEINVRKQAEEALRQAQAQLTDRAGQLEGLVAERTAELTLMNQQLEAFVYSIAHDLRAPLRAMQGLSAMLVKKAGPVLDDTCKDYADRIKKSAEFMDAMLIDLLAFSRISHRGVELTPVDLNSEVQSVLARLREEIQAKNAQVENVGPWPFVLAHQATLDQVLFNLVSNALKFVADDGPPILRLWSEDRDPFIRVWVDDNGPGIAPRHQEQIFALFTRLEREKYGGTGVGLAIVKKGVEQMGGRTGVVSNVGHGSHFWFELRKSP